MVVDDGANARGRPACALLILPINNGGGGVGLYFLKNHLSHC